MSFTITNELIMGGNFVVGKSLVDRASPMTLTSLRWMIAIVCLLPMVWFKEKKNHSTTRGDTSVNIDGNFRGCSFNIFQFLALEKHPQQM